MSVSFFPQMTLEELQVRITEFMKARGLDTSDLKKYDITFDVAANINQTGLFRELWIQEWVVKLEYHDFDWNTIPSRSRIRRSHPPAEGGKYLGQKKIKGSELYLSYRDDWRDVAHNPRIKFVLAEGEFKAITTEQVLSAAGLSDKWAVAGIPGASMFRIRNGVGQYRYPDMFNMVEANGREFYFAFDWDPKQVTRDAVSMSIERAATDIIGRGGRCFHIDLSRTEFFKEWDQSKKLGIDDYFMSGGTWDDIVRHALVEVTPILQAQAELLDRYIICERPTVIIDGERGTVYKKGDWLDIVANKIDTIEVDGKTKKLQAGPEFMRHPGRPQVQGMTFHPDEDSALSVVNGQFNMWKDWPKHASRGRDDGLLAFKRVLERMGCECLWPAFCHLVQRPQERWQHAYLVMGIETGTGKSTIGNVMRSVLGEYGVKLDGNRFFGKFNALMEAKLFVHVDEVRASDVSVKDTTDHIRDFITTDKMNVERKGVDAYEMPMFARLFMTSNEVTPVLMNSQERRVFVLSPDGRGLVEDSAHQADLRLLNSLTVEDKEGILLALRTEEFVYDPAKRAEISELSESIIENSKSSATLYAESVLDYLEEGSRGADGAFFTVVDAFRWASNQGYRGGDVALGRAISEVCAARRLVTQTSGKEQQIAMRVAHGPVRKGRWISWKGIRWSSSAEKAQPFVEAKHQ